VGTLDFCPDRIGNVHILMFIDRIFAYKAVGTFFVFYFWQFRNILLFSFVANTWELMSFD
jgi:hypothetical protein